MSKINHVFIQARMESTRFPNKILKKILNKTILELIFERAKRIEGIDNIILVTGSAKKNSLLIKEATRLRIPFFCGHAKNILDRFYQASTKFNSDNIIRITGDNPLIDYNLINNGINIFSNTKCDILTTSGISDFPLGFNFDIFTQNALTISWNDQFETYDDSNIFYTKFISPTKYMLENKKFKKHYFNELKYAQLRLTLDYPEDFELIKNIFENLYNKNKFFIFSDIVNYLKENPELINTNKEYQINEKARNKDK